MARVARIKPSRTTVYHLVSRTVGQDFYLGDVEKEMFTRILKDLLSRYFVRLYTYCLMSNHFHLVVEVAAEVDVSDSDVRVRLSAWRNRAFAAVAENIVRYKRKWCDVSEFTKDLKQKFSRWYNERHTRTGYLWGDRFKSVILGDEQAIRLCMAYVDLNPVRAKLVVKPEDYRHSGLGLLSAGVGKGLLHVDALELFAKFSADANKKKTMAQRIADYRAYIYDQGRERPPDAAPDRNFKRRNAGHIPAEVAQAAAEKAYAQSRLDLFHRRVRYFTDGLAIGSRDFVERVFREHRDRFHTRAESRKGMGIGNYDVYSFRRLREITI